MGPILTVASSLIFFHASLISGTLLTYSFAGESSGKAGCFLKTKLAGKHYIITSYPSHLILCDYKLLKSSNFTFNEEKKSKCHSTLSSNIAVNSHKQNVKINVNKFHKQNFKNNVNNVENHFNNKP